MAKLLTIRSNATAGLLTPANISGDYIFTSAEYSNSFSSNLFRGAKVDIKYSNLVSDNTVHFQGVVEGKNQSGTWSPVGYQFDPFRAAGVTQDRVILLDPSVFWPDVGISNVIYVGGKTIAEVSPQQIALPEIWRLRIAINGVNPSFTSIAVDIEAELFNPQ